MQLTFDPKNFKFRRSQQWAIFLGLYQEKGLKAIYKQFQKRHRREFSRSMTGPFVAQGYGIEIGVGWRTVMPVQRTILSDRFEDHGKLKSLANAFFPADAIPYGDGSFEFIYSEHTLEHLANPIKALMEWMRVLKRGGVILLTLPHGERGDDKFRPRTTLSHLIDDFKHNVPDDDRTHLNEWIKNVAERGMMADYYRHMNYEELPASGSLHHHVWHTADIVELLKYLKLQIETVIDVVEDRSDSFFVAARKL